MTGIFDHGTHREAIASVFVAQTSLSKLKVSYSSSGARLWVYFTGSVLPLIEGLLISGVRVRVMRIRKLGEFIHVKLTPMTTDCLLKEGKVVFTENKLTKIAE